MVDKVYLANCLYAYDSLNQQGPLYKIGITYNTAKRIRQINRDYEAGEWSVIHNIVCLGPRELTELLEKSLHYLFRPKRHPFWFPQSKEFFSLDERDIRWIKSLDYIDCEHLEKLVTSEIVNRGWQSYL